MLAVIIRQMARRGGVAFVRQCPAFRRHLLWIHTVLATANITMQFGGKPLFENVSVKFGGGNRYGLIGANGCGKSTLMKILGGDLEPSAGNVSVDPGKRLGKLRQDQFAFEDHTVLDTVIMGHDRVVADQAGARPHLRAAADERGRRHGGRRTWRCTSPSWTATPPRPAPAICCSVWTSRWNSTRAP